MASKPFPKVSTKAWTTLRDKAATAPSTRFTPNAVAAMMGLASPESARTNIVGPMTRLGLFDSEGALTPLGNKWRIDGSYAEACDEILTQLYPDELNALVADSGMPDPEQVRTWFDHQGFGASNAANMTSTFVRIASKTLPDTPSSESSKSPTAKKKKSAKATKTNSRTQQPTSPQQPPAAATSATAHNGPSLHIDIQIHIPSDAAPDQIDQIFASMAKHLYQAGAGA